MREAIEYLRGDHIDPRLHEVTIALAAEMLVTGKIVATAEEGRAMAQKHLDDGRAAHFFERMVMDLGGPDDMLASYKNHLPLATHKLDVYPDEGGLLTSVDTRAIGLAIITLGGGRRQVSDKIDHSVGLSAMAATGDEVGRAAKPLCTIYARNKDEAEEAAKTIRKACHIAPEGETVARRPVVREHIAK